MIHTGFVGLLGLPNVGKSTFLNFLLGENLSIVSSKPQTTRQAFSGVVSTDDYQLILLDAPGFVESKKGLFEFLNSEYQSVIKRSEHLLFLVSHDMSDTPAFRQALKLVQESGKPVSYVMTKTDLAPKEWLVDFVKDLGEEARILQFNIKDKPTVAVSEFLKAVAQTLPKEHHPLYDPDLLSLDKTRDIVAEFVREQCFLQLNQEIPFGVGVIIKSFKRQKNLLHIEANLLVEKENHKAIVIGKGGAQLKKIGGEARKKIEEFLGEKIFLGLHVAYKKNWMKNQAIMKEVGYHNES